MEFATDQVHIPTQLYNYKLLGFTNDMFKEGRIKNMARQKRGTSSTKFNNIGFEPNIPQGNNWQEFLNDSEYKD